MKDSYKCYEKVLIVIVTAIVLCFSVHVRASGVGNKESAQEIVNEYFSLIGNDWDKFAELYTNEQINSFKNFLENEKNIVGNRVDSYVTNMDFSQGIRANLNAPFRIIYSREARKKIRAVLDDFQPDVVHLNNIQYHLTPSIILEINKWRKETKKECRIVYTTHDYQLVCPSHGMFDVNMKPCERCLDGHYIHCLQTKCLKNSRAKSLLGTLDGYMWKYSKA